MKQLLVMRHAKSSWKEAGMADHDRPLNKRGRAAAPLMGRRLRERQIRPDLLLCSTARRAQETAQLVVEAAELELAPLALSDLYLAPPDIYIAQLRHQPDAVASAMVVGHNPGLEELLESLCGVTHAVPTAAVAIVELDIAQWSELTASGDARLAEFWRPREME